MPASTAPKSKDRVTDDAKRKISPISAKNLASLRWFAHGFSTRVGGRSACYGRGGALNLGITPEDTRENVERNRAAFMRAIGASKMKLVTLRQVHSDIIHLVDHAPEAALAGDGLITATPGLLLSVRTADCFPIILADPVHRVVGVFHAGWRPTLKRMVEKGIGEMRLHFGTDPTQIQAAIGPGIGACCYKVGEEVREKFHSRFAYAGDLFHQTEEYDEVKLKYPMLFLTARAPGHSHDLFPKAIHLDLAQANRRQLLDAGVPEANIFSVNECTACKPRKYFSHRAQKGVTGRMMAAVGIKQGRTK